MLPATPANNRLKAKDILQMPPRASFGLERLHGTVLLTLGEKSDCHLCGLLMS